ncbi:MAG: RNA polymerase sigma factor [Thermoanaerobaculia bacterium]
MRPEQEPARDVGNDEAALIEAARRGDRDAYGQLVRRNLPRALAVAHGIVRNRADAEDLAQEAFVRAHAHLERFRPGAPFAPWLFRIVTNLALDLLKHRGRLREEELGETHAAPRATEADTAAHANEKLRRIDAALELLPEMQRIVARLSLVEELEHADIAAALDITEGTVRSHLSHARAALRAKLSDLYEVS